MKIDKDDVTYKEYISANANLSADKKQVIRVMTKAEIRLKKFKERYGKKSDED